MPAKSDAARNPHEAASSTAVELTSRSSARAASTPRPVHTGLPGTGVLGRSVPRSLPVVLERNEIPDGFHNYESAKGV